MLFFFSDKHLVHSFLPTVFLKCGSAQHMQPLIRPTSYKICPPLVYDHKMCIQ
jgi:hypothetical protein